MAMRLTKDEVADLIRNGAVFGPTVQLPSEAPADLPTAKGRTAGHQPGRMNKTEAAYARHLDDRKALGDVAGYWFETIKLRLADKTWYTVDFIVMLKDGSLQIHEVKGRHIWDDAMVKIKVAASLYPIFRFFLCRKDQKGGWTVKEVSAN